MRIHVKLLIVTLLLVALLIGATGVVVYGINLRNAQERLQLELDTLSQKLSMQVEVNVARLDAASLFLLSNPDFLSALSTVTMKGRATHGSALILANDTSTLLKTLRSYALAKHFTRATVFGRDGSYYSSAFGEKALDAQRCRDIAQTLPWLDETDALNGRMRFLAPYADPWSGEGEQVYGVARAVAAASGQILYIELQRPIRDFEALFALPGYEAVTAALTDDTGACLFGSVPQAMAGDIVTASKNAYGLSVNLHCPAWAAQRSMDAVVGQVVAISALALLASAAYMYLMTRRLTRPLRVLQSSMEQTALHNLADNPAPRQTDELEALTDTYNALCARLDVAMREKLEAQRLELNARMDALQAQIDPHFLYNTLNVVMSRAALIGDEEIVEICQAIARLLRYSTDTVSRTATLADEIAYTKTYLMLLEKRYKHRLACRIEAEDSILGETVPKLIFQPLLENAVKHGFAGIGGVMRLSLHAWGAGGFWLAQIEDNGEGFSEASLACFAENVRRIRAGEGLSGRCIGGMGLATTYARLYHHYGARFEMRCENGQTGARVVLRMPKEGETP